ncbi:MAG: hypothetical protein CENE_00329 [Candidatus Celerinatantimonas neptuna]|nr:MAG: hypothetical protein CENE_00329 [Candidatus Celerinatantimonas neptuna]
MSSRAISILLEQISEQEQQAIAELTLVRNQFLMFNQQLKQLESYRRSYMEQSLSKGASGVQASGFHQYQAFIQTIEKAEVEQQQNVERLKNNVDQKRNDWLAVQSRRKALEKLLERQRIQAQKKADITEQKLLDEYAMFSFYRRQQSV